MAGEGTPDGHGGRLSMRMCSRGKIIIAGGIGAVAFGGEEEVEHEEAKNCFEIGKVACPGIRVDFCLPVCASVCDSTLLTFTYQHPASNFNLHIYIAGTKANFYLYLGT